MQLVPFGVWLLAAFKCSARSLTHTSVKVSASLCIIRRQSVSRSHNKVSSFNLTYHLPEPASHATAALFILTNLLVCSVQWACQTLSAISSKGSVRSMTMMKGTKMMMRKMMRRTDSLSSVIHMLSSSMTGLSTQACRCCIRQISPGSQVETELMQGALSLIHALNCGQLVLASRAM